MPDNHPSDGYFYQILVFTGQRSNAGTKSTVNKHRIAHVYEWSLLFLRFISFFPAMKIKRKYEHCRIHIDEFFNVAASMHLSCPFPSKFVRRQATNRCQHWFVSIVRSLGLLNCIRIWHDNSGQGQSASWFLKYIIVRDLQTMNKFHFIAQRWFAVEDDDGRVIYWFLFMHDIYSHYSRLNVSCPLLVMLKNNSFPMFSRKRPIIAFPMDIFGFPSFLDHHPIDLRVFNVVHVVSFFSMFPCF
jgi:PLAT/LH2 domain